MATKVRNAKNISVNLVEYDESVDEIVITKWDLNSKLDSNIIYNGDFVKRHINGNDFCFESLVKDGFSTPLLFENKSGLGLILPPDDFTVDDVALNVGKNRILDVVDVRTQDAIGMTMREWCEYFKSPTKTQLLNVISLEYSQSKMDEIVKAPDVVLDLDWLENCWPQNCRDITRDNKSYLKTLTYPKVRKYCLMSVGGCYTDFHIDLGGTSVWYHIFKGQKVFWIIPPTEENLCIYEKWCLSSDQSSCFFPDLVIDCQKVHLQEGNTFMIPSGWIHGVYTPVDSLVFGGNFLHYLSIPMQLRIYDVEEKLKIHPKYRYPFFIEIHWYALAMLVTSFNDHSYVSRTSNKHFNQSNKKPLYYVNNGDIKGIQFIYQWLKRVTMNSSKYLPSCIEDPSKLLSDAEKLCINFSDHEPYQFQDAKSEPQTFCQQYKKNLISYLDNPSKYLKLEIIPLAKKEIKKIKRLHPFNQKRQINPKVKITRTAEIPQELFNKITQRTGSRQIIRPKRFIENPFDC